MDLPFEIEVHAVKALLDGDSPFLLLDCREQNEYDTVKIDGSQLLPMSEIQQRVSELGDDKERHIVVHCHHGGRSLQVMQWLRTKQGFANAQSMAGGIDAWAVEIDPELPRY